MPPFRFRTMFRTADDLDSLDLDSSGHRPKSLLHGLDLDFPEKMPDATKASGAMPRATSMLEMNVIHDMQEFGNAMDALSGESSGEDDPRPRRLQSHVVKAKSNTLDLEDDGFFIDVDVEADGEGEGRVGEEDVLQLSSSPDCVAGLVPQAPRAAQAPEAKPSGGGMRRVMSVASLSTTQKSRFSLSSMMQDIHPISEEEACHHDHNEEKEETMEPAVFSKEDRRKPPLAFSSKETAKPRLAFSNKEDVKQPKLSFPDEAPPGLSLDDTNHTCDSIPEKISLCSSQNSRRPRSSSRSSANSGMPLRSSMKGSNSNLRSSLKSCTSIESDNSLGLDSSQHSNNNINAAARMKRNVSFSSLEIRSYNVTLGDAPTSYGPPVSLDWEYDPAATAEYDLETYEEYRTDSAPRRNRQQMLMPPMHRQYLLMREAGFTKGEIQVAMEEAKRVARNREKTKKMSRVMGMERVEEALEKTKRRFGKLGKKK